MSLQLFQPLRVGDITLQHRVVMASLTRNRATNYHVPNNIMVQLYIQRAAAPGTFIISEGMIIAPAAGGYPNAPGIWNQSQVEGRGSRSRSELIYISAALVAWSGSKPRVDEALPYVSSSSTPLVKRSDAPIELSTSDIQRYVEHFARAADIALNKVRFDGAEIHSANGYLLDQFLQYVCNKWTEECGRSVPNRCRIVLEVVDEAVKVVGPHKAGLRLAPWKTFQGL
ncbi:NADH:flavin oxidoreductase/NADH oxidase [Ceratobasidium sp. AG-Ba]|nr:NADH:flavin oxidoreductase/NADH oxidase [Ceratobasidium sp. AG-Ba]